MSDLLRRPAAVPAMFSSGVEPRPAARRGWAATRRWSAGSGLMVLPALILATEVPFMRGAADLLRLALPH